MVVSILLCFMQNYLLSLNLELRNNDGASALWLALQQLDSSYLSSNDTSEYNHTFAARLIERGSNTDAVDARSGNSLLHRAALESKEAAAVFLVHRGAVPNHRNTQDETPIHIAAKNGLHKLVKNLLDSGADPNMQTALKPKANPLAPLSIPAAGAAESSSTQPMSLSASAKQEGSITGASVASPMVGADILSPSTLGALNALSFTSQVCLLIQSTSKY